MAKRSKQAAATPPDASTQGVTILLCSADAALREAWAAAQAPPHFCLQTQAELRPEHLAAGRAYLVLVDAEAAAEAAGPLAEALEAAAGRCVWTGAPGTIDRLGPLRVAQGYDILPTPTTPGFLTQRLAAWERSIRRTAALEEMGRRVEELAQGNERLASRLAAMEAQLQAGHEQLGRLQQVLDRIRQVGRLSREVNTLDFEKIVRVCIERLPALVEAASASLYLYDAAADRLVLQAHSHGRPIAERVDLAENPQSPMALAVRRGELLVIGEFTEFERTADMIVVREFQEQYATKSCLIVPLIGGGRVRGVLNLADKRGGGRFDETIDLPVVEQIAELIGAGISNVEVYQEMERHAKTDPLTDLANRRATEIALAHEMDRSRRYGSDLTIMMLDVDHLKMINDRHGHEAGDLVLKNLADTLAKTVRAVDVPGRWTGGDEFLVVLPDTSTAQARRLAQRLLDQIQEKPVACGNEQLLCGLSVGVAQYRPGESMESIIHRADQAMYVAKQGGRSRIATDTEAQPPPEAEDTV
ncbi:MAG: sensor domain-containing diguanylate cyclase [Planctomycetota bacterium]|nr:sensor domain-containing diguanylate cyclase [Planctomycetota bacterium]